MMRELSIFERSTVYHQGRMPLNIVVAYELENAPPPNILRQVVQDVQARHPLLSAAVDTAARPWRFVPAAAAEFDFIVIQSADGTGWLPIAEAELAHGFDLQTGPLFRFHYLYQPQGRSAVVMTFSHTIADGASLINLIHETLTTCAVLLAGEELPFQEPRLLLSTPESRFPPNLQRTKLAARLVGFVGRQMTQELTYRLGALGKPRLPVSSTAVNKIMLIPFSAEETAQLERFASHHRLVLSSVLSAAVARVVWQRILYGRAMPIHTISFADLRPLLEPPGQPADTTPHIATLRHLVKLKPAMDLLDTATALNQTIHDSVRRNEKFLYYALNYQLVQMTHGLKNVRMGPVALSYLGRYPLQEKYGAIRLVGLHPFVSTPPFAPFLSGQAGILNKKLFIDLVYQDADLSPQEADDCAQNIKAELLSVI